MISIIKENIVKVKALQIALRSERYVGKWYFTEMNIFYDM
jgi:hypothetical protein